MRKLILGGLLAIVIVLAKVEAYAQTSLPKETTCQPSAEEVLSIIRSVYNLSPTPEGVLIAGEIGNGRARFRIQEESLTLLQALAWVGGIAKSANHPLYLIRQSSEDKLKIRLEIDLRDIKQGRAKDVMLEKRDVIFVPRGCVDGKLLPPTKPEFPRGLPRWRDYPHIVPNKRVVR